MSTAEATVRIEVLCTGDELLTGLTADTNSPFFMSKLLEQLGQRVQREVVVGDVRADLVAAIRAASERSDVVLVSGGLGPTADDLTAECAAVAQGVPLVESGPALEALKARFARRGMTVTANNLKQAMVPAGSEVVVNQVGSAPMFIQSLAEATLFYVPGVPREYRHLVEHEVLPRLRARVEGEVGRTHRAFKLLKTIGLPESHLDQLVAPIALEHPQVIFGFRTHAPENHLKLLAEADSAAGAEAALRAAEAKSRAVLAPWLFGEEGDRFSDSVGRLLVAQGRSVAVAESCTGGRLSALLTEPAGASAYFLGGAVTYQESGKQRWARVKPQTLAAHGAVSREVAVEMAEGIRAEHAADFGLAVTGFAGPTGGTEADPVGTVYCALAGRGETLCERQVFAGELSAEGASPWCRY